MIAKFKKIILLIPLLFLLSITAFAQSYDDESEPSPNTPMSLEQLKTQMEALQEEITRLRDESDVRKKLAATVEEATENEKEILTAAGKDYSLAKEGTLGIDYGFSYSYNSVDILENFINPAVDHSANHNITNSVNIKYAARNNITISGTLPFIYKSDQRSTSSEKNATDIGDLRLNAMWQPKKSVGNKPTVLLTGSFTYPSGISPYKIDTDNALSTGSGLYSITTGASISKSLDPVYVFGNCSLNYAFPQSGLNQRRSSPGYSDDVLKKVTPGYSIGASCGLAYALSYTVNINTSISVSHTTKYEYKWRIYQKKSTSGTSTAASLNFGTGWRISPKRSITTTLGIGLTNSASDFTLSFSIPFSFKL